MKIYSVLLLRPFFHLDTFYTFAKGNTPQQAVDDARRQVCVADNVPHDDAYSYTVLLVIEGEHEDLTCFTD